MVFEIECQCAGEPLSPGQSGCIPMVGRDKFSIYFDYTDSDGNKNGIPAGTVLNQAFLVAKLNNSDITKRWWIAPKMFAVETPPPENKTEDRDGIPIPTGEETKQPALFQHSKRAANPALKAFYDSIRCRDLGVINATFKGQLSGMNDGLGNLIGVHVQEDTLSAQYAPPVDGALQKMMVSYLVDELENDANRDFIEAAKIEFPVKDWFASQPLEVIPIELSNANLDTITFTLDGLYGGVDRKKPIENFVSVDYSNDLGVTTAEVFNKNTQLEVGFTTVEDGAIPGKYVGTLAAPQSDQDVMQIKIFKSGYHMRTFEVTLIDS